MKREISPAPYVASRFGVEALEAAQSAFMNHRSLKIPMLDEEMPYCNDNCLHCGVADIMASAVLMPLERVVRHLHRLRPHSGGRVMFGVSELSIRTDFLKIMRAAKQLDYKTVAVVTNGRRFVDPRFARAAAEAGMTHALVSVYGGDLRTHEGMTRTPGSYEQTVGGLKNLLEGPIKVMTNTVVTQRNVEELESIVERLHQWGVSRSCLSFVQKIGNAKRYSERLIPTWEKAVPSMVRAYEKGRALGMVMGLGGIPPCVAPQYPEAFGVDDLTVIHNEEPGDQIRARSPYHYAEPCADCGDRVVCHGVQEEAIVDEDMSQLRPVPGPLKEKRIRSALGYAMFPDLFGPSQGI